MTDTMPVDLDQIRADHARLAKPVLLGGSEVSDQLVAEYAEAWDRQDAAVPAMVAEIAELRAALALASGGDTARDTARQLLAKASDHAKRADRYRTAWRNARGRARRARTETDMWKRQLTLAEESRDRAVRDLYDADALTDHLCDANRELGREARLLRVVAVEAIHAADDLVKQARARTGQQFRAITSTWPVTTWRPFASGRTWMVALIRVTDRDAARRP